MRAENTNRNEAGLSVDLQQRLLRAILDFMSRSGLTDKAIQEAFSTCIEARRGFVLNKPDETSGEGGNVGNGNVSAELIRLWTRDGRYITRDALPRPLPLSKGRHNIHSLILKLDSKADPVSVVESMKAVGLLRQLSSGRYIPTAESVTIDKLHPLAVEHVAKSLIRLVATVCRNTDPSRKSIPLIERYAYVPDLSEAEAAAFAEFTRAQGMAFLEAVDDWLEQRRAGRVTGRGRVTSRKGMAAGVHLVAFLGDDGFNKSAVSPKTKLSGGSTRLPATPA